MLLSYESFATQRRLVESRRELLVNIFNQFEDIKPVINEAITIVESGAFDLIFESDNLELNEESLIQKMKDKFDQAVQVAKQKGKDALTGAQEKIIKLGGSIGNVIKLMVQKLKEWIQEEFQAAKSAYQKIVSTKMSDIKAAIESTGADAKNQMIKEVKNLKQMTSVFYQWITSGFTKDVAKGAVEVAKEDVTEAFEIAIIDAINEAVILGQLDFTDMLNEGGGDHGPSIPFLSTITHKLHNVPPFSLLDKVKKGAEKVSGAVLDKMSYYATELAGAPGPFKFVALASLIGIVTEVAVKHKAHHAIIHAIPGIGTIASWITNIAMIMAIVGVIETLMKEAEAGKSAEH